MYYGCRHSFAFEDKKWNKHLALSFRLILLVRFSSSFLPMLACVAGGIRARVPTKTSKQTNKKLAREILPTFTYNVSMQL